MDEIAIDRRDGVVTLILNRPERRNALSLALVEGLTARLAGLAEDGVRCLVLTGRGKAFSAGADVKEWGERAAAGRLDDYDWVAAAQRLIRHLAGFPAPTLAALNGIALGAGLDLALACDLRLVAASASLRPGYSAMAYPPDVGGSWLLPHLIGPERAKRFLYLDETLDANQALALGLVSEVVEDEGLAATSAALAARIAAGPTAAFREAKALIDGAFGRDLAAQLALERAAGERCRATRDATEALAAAAEKRPPRFTGG